MPEIFKKIADEGSFRVLGINEMKLYSDMKSSFDALPPNASEKLAERAKKAAETPSPRLSASEYAMFGEIGDRAVYEGSYFSRRRRMLNIALGVIAGSTELVKPLADAVWEICEETTWVIPAHNPGGGRDRLSYDYREPIFIDLFSAATAGDLAMVYSFCKKELDAFTPMICERLLYELDRRIFKPFLSRDDMWWMGFDDRHTNNWTPWITSNVLLAFMLGCSDDSIRRAALVRCMTCLDNFTRSYAEDGGCDEGCGYWTVAAASWFDAAEEIYDMTGGDIDVMREPLVRAMGEYIVNFYVGGGWCVNFADCSPRSAPPSVIVRRYGRRCGSALMKEAGEALYNRSHAYEGSGDTTPYRMFKNLLEEIDILSGPAHGMPDAPKAVWYPGIEVAIFRGDTFGDGLLLAAKGGSNNESHNHNDIGTFTVYDGTEPLIIDAGVETYSKKTFSSERYSIWTMRSSYHNLPVFGGCEQLPGAKYRAASAECDAAAQTLRLGLESAYPKDAHIVKYTRECSLTDGAVRVRDVFELSEAEDVTFTFMLAAEPEPAEEHAVLSGGRVLTFSPELQPEVDEIILTDAKIRRDWSARANGTEPIFRLRLTVRGISAGDYIFTVR